jgi:prepilin-type N-terminal cleavage/methylation domain-containing protein
METRKKAFTLIEVMTVIGIIALLIGILIPAITKVRGMVKDTQEKAQITTIGMAITAFKNDYGDYPPSDYWNLSKNLGGFDYSSAQMLSEALLGWDLMGFHPESDWESNGRNKNNDPGSVYEGATTGTQQQREENLRQRKGPYLELSNTEVFHLKDAYDNTMGLEGVKTYVISDVYYYKKITNRDTGKTQMTGAPILYYKAKTQFKELYPQASTLNDSIYDCRDNIRIIQAKSQQDIKEKINNQDHPWVDIDNFYSTDPEVPSIVDPKMINVRKNWPYRPDSYLLISAGADGEYGTVDDITNFK